MDSPTYILIKDSICEILSYLRKNHSTTEVRVRRKGKIKVNSNGVETYYEQEQDYFNFPFEIEIWKTISKELSISKKCINALVHQKWFDSLVYFTDETGKPIATPYMEEIYLSAYNDTLGIFFNNYLKEAKSFEFNESILIEIYSEFEKIRDSEEITEIAFITLYGFQMEENRLKLGNGIYIAKMTDFDYQYIFLPGSTTESNDLITFTKIHYKLCCIYSYKEKNKVGEVRQKIWEQLQNVVIALRLTSEGSFHPFTIYTCIFPSNKKYIFNNSSLSVHPFESLASYSPFINFNLTKTKMLTFSNIFKEIINPSFNDSLKPLRLGLQKFNQSFSRISYEDKILDYVTILEGLCCIRRDQISMNSL